jgi:hypothetical protein
MFSLIVEQIWSLLLTGHASLNLREWIVTSRAREALRALFMTGDPPCLNEGMCGQKAGEPPMEGPDIVLSPRIGNVRRTVPENGIRVSEFLPEILAYHRTRGTKTLDLTRIYSFPNGRPDDVVVPPSDAEEDPTHVPFQVRDRSGGTPLQLTDASGSGVHGVEPLAQVSTPAAPDAAHDSMVVHPTSDVAD